MSNNQKSYNGFFNGFLWGALLGAGIVFFVGTKKGKKLLKVLTQEGLEGVSELGDVIDKLAKEKNYEESAVNKETPVVEDGPSVNGHGLKTTTRRFFRRKSTA